MKQTSFWERDPVEVARELVGGIVYKFNSMTDVNLMGMIFEADAYRQPLQESNGEIFSLAPGTITVFSSRRGPIPVISAHKPNQTGLITLRKMFCSYDAVGPTDIASRLNFKDLTGKSIGHDSGLYIARSNIDLTQEGLVISDRMPSDGPKNRDAYFSLARA